jgi:hypothetical protein
MTANSIGAIPAVITFSHHINLDKIVSADKFLENWYLQILGDVSKGGFNLGSGNTIKSPPTGTVGSNDLTELQSGPPLRLSQLAATSNKSILPYITNQTLPSKSDYNAAYNQAVNTISKVFSGTTNKDLRSDQSKFPVLWLQDIQNAQLALSSAKPSNNFVNNSGGAPEPTTSKSNYLLGEVYVGLNDKGKDANNGDVTYIEQFGLPLSLNLWYADSNGNLYRGVQDQNGAGLSIPGANSYVSNGAYNASANNAAGLASKLYSNPELQQQSLSRTDGSLYFNPKDLYAGTPNAVVAPKYGDFYDYFHYLSTLSASDYPIQWSGQFNQKNAYRVKEAKFNGFSQPGDYRQYDQDSYISLKLEWGNYTQAPPNPATPPITLKQKADIIIPWLGIPQHVPGITPANNQYAISNSSTETKQPSGGWQSPPHGSSIWNSTSEAYSGDQVALTPLQDKVNVASHVTGGSYQVKGLFNYYSDLFAVNELTLISPTTPYTWEVSGDTLLNANGSLPLSTAPNVVENLEHLKNWNTLTDSSGKQAGLQIRLHNGQWQFQGTNSHYWTGIGKGSTFKVPNNGFLPGQIQPNITLLKGPDAQTSLADLLFAPTPGVSSDIPITGFEVLAADKQTVIATLTLGDIYQANQLVNPNNFVYASTAPGILGANAGYYYRINPADKGVPYATQLNLQNDVYGTAVGDFLSLVNAGLLGATQSFAYKENPPTQIGKLANLDPSYSVDKATQEIKPSPWLDKSIGPVAKGGLFGSNAWQATLPQGVETPYSYWASLINEYAPSVYGFGLSDRFKNGYDISFNLERVDLTTFTKDQKTNFKLLQFNPSAVSASAAFSLMNADKLDYLYPVFVEYQIGGFGQPGDPGYNYNYDFLPDYNNGRAIVNVPTPQGEKQIRVEFQGGQLRPGSDVEIISDLGINQAALQDLAGLGVKTNATAIAFQLATDPGAEASLSSDPNLVAAEFLADLRDPFGRLPARKLLYYALNTATGALSPLSYDPITGAGARFFDLNNDGTPDFFTLSLIDGGYGDKDGLANGVVVDPSVAGFVDLTNLQFTSAGSGTVTVSDPSNTAPAAVNLRATLNSRPDSSNQIGYVVLNAAEVASADALLSDLNWLRGRAQTLFSTLESKDVTLPPAGSAFARDLQLINGQSLRFFEVVDASLEQLSSLSDSRFRRLSSAAFANGQVAFSSTSGVSFSLSLLPSDLGLNALISTAQGRAPVLDLSAFTAAQSLSGSVVLGREADFNSSAGFYRSLDANGTVIAADGITRLRPGDSAYAAEALRSSNLIAQLGNLAVADNQTTSRSFSGLSGGSFLAPFAQVNGNTFFAYGAASTDGISHFRALGNNLFGLEDIVGGGDRDFDDLVIGFNFDAVA